MRVIKIYLFVLALVVIPVFMGFYIKEARSEPVGKKSQEYVYCKVGDDSTAWLGHLSPCLWLI